MHARTRIYSVLSTDLDTVIYDRRVMSALLDMISEARDLRDAAQAELVRAIRNAADALDERGRKLHTGTAIARAAGVSKQRISQMLSERGSHDPE